MAILEKVRANSISELPEIKKILRNKYGKDVNITVEKDSSYRETQEYSWREDCNYVSRREINTIIVIAEDDSPEPEPKPQKSLEEIFATLRFKRTSTAT